VGLTANLLADLIWLLLAAAVVGLLYWTRRQRVLKFFGLQNHRRIVVYASRLDIPRGGSLRPDGSQGSFDGIASPDYEANLTAAIGAFFAGFARLLRWHGRPLLRWADITVDILVSPPLGGPIEPRDTLMAIGSPGYNIVSEAVEANFGAPARFVNDNCALALSDEAPLEDSDPFLGAAQRLVNTTTGQAAFYVGGPSDAGTTAATNYLLREWKYLARRYPGGSFYVIVRAKAGGAQYDVVTASP
jgi:hypothetical protein